MQRVSGRGVSWEGFLLLDPSMNPIFVNRAAAEILLYPLKVEVQKSLDGPLASKIRDKLLLRPSSAIPALVPRFQSGKRLYLCRSFGVNAVTGEGHQSSVAVVLERGSAGSISLVQVSERFNLTTREQEVLQFLSEGGLTTKEIAARMRISPNTVKTFLRSIMLKMRVTTRSGILGKAFATRL